MITVSCCSPLVLNSHAGAPLSLLSLGNNSCLKSTFSAMQERFAMLYKRKCYLHHYLDFMELSGITDAIETVRTLTDGYAALDGGAPTTPPLVRSRCPDSCLFLFNLPLPL